MAKTKTNTTLWWKAEMQYEQIFRHVGGDYLALMDICALWVLFCSYHCFLDIRDAVVIGVCEMLTIF